MTLSFGRAKPVCPWGKGCTSQECDLARLEVKCAAYQEALERIIAADMGEEPMTEGGDEGDACDCGGCQERNRIALQALSSPDPAQVIIERLRAAAALYRDLDHLLYAAPGPLPDGVEYEDMLIGKLKDLRNRYETVLGAETQGG